MSNPRNFLRENRNDKTQRIQANDVKISDLIKTQGQDTDQVASQPEAEEKPDAPVLRKLSPVEQYLQAEQSSQQKQQLQQEYKEHYTQQKQQKESVQPVEGKRLGRRKVKEEPDEKMMVYLPPGLMATFKEGRLEEKFVNDRAFYIHIFESYFRNKPYNQFSGEASDKKKKR